MYTNYDWMRERYEIQLADKLQNKIDFGEISDYEASIIFNREIEEWEAGYSDYMYDLIGDR